MQVAGHRRQAEPSIVRVEKNEFRIVGRRSSRAARRSSSRLRQGDAARSLGRLEHRRAVLETGERRVRSITAAATAATCAAVTWYVHLTRARSSRRRSTSSAVSSRRTPAPWVQGVLAGAGGGAHFAVSDTGTLVYLGGPAVVARDAGLGADPTGAAAKR